MYLQALTKSWQLVWRNKILWIFGLLSILIGEFGLTNFVGRILIFLSGPTPTADRFLPYLSWQMWHPLLSGWSILLSIIMLAVCALVVLLAVAAEGALIAAAGDWFSHGRADTFHKAWNKGIKHFWLLFAVRVGERAILFVLLALMTFLVVHFLAVDTLLTRIATGLIFLAGFIIALMVTSVAIYASGYIVQDENRLGAALTKARLLFSRHVLVSVEMSLLEIIFSFVPAAILIVGGFWLLLPSVALTLVASVSGMSYLILVGVYTTLAAYVLLVALVGAIFNAWITSSWMFLFMKMHREGVASRVMHYLARVFGR